MNKQDAVRGFREEVLPRLKYMDDVAQAEAWNNWTDSLCKDGQITME